RWSFAGSRSGAMALLAGFVAADGDSRLGAEERLFEFEREVFAQVGAPLYAGTAASATAAEHIAEAEEFSEDVDEILEDGRVESRSLRRGATKSGVSIAVIDGTLVRVGENGIGFAYFLELLFRIRIVGVTVGVILERELAVSGLQFHVGDRAAHTQNFVVVSFCVSGQINP